ncbi:MAG: YkgJ family cysteine cluster protein [Desulfobacteraceae bacterium]|nr:YkgJ family cysteine cluster protein [Desulfobacteraceae bacterium]
MPEIKSDLKFICQKECPSRWCCSIDNFAPPPVSREEKKKIEHLTGWSDFFDQTASHYVLKVKENGFCIFFDEQKKSCEVYKARPLDCQLFPIVCFAPNIKESVWLIWDCPYSRQLDEIYIENFLTYLENNYVKGLSQLWSYDPEGYDLKHPAGYRIIREIKIIR